MRSQIICLEKLDGVVDHHILRLERALSPCGEENHYSALDRIPPRLAS